jgi:CheY-like chemotaxis protein
MVYAGKESDVLEPIDISKTVEEMLGLLRSSISKRSQLVTDLDQRLPAVKARRAQIRQILMNLVVNASDAIKEGNGVIRVTTERVTLGPNRTSLPTEELVEGDYVQLEVSDNGCGISEDIRVRIFDPFFSTKSAGRGLGLPVIHGIVRSLKGTIRVASEAGSGTAFQILLPSAGAICPIRQPIADNEDNEREDRSCNATVLLVEDEAPIRVAVEKMLSKAGFTVFAAADGMEAVRLLHDKGTRIDILFLDMTIPGCPSHEVLSKAVQHCPDVKVILTSAYGEEMVRTSLNEPQIYGFVRKPFQLGNVVSTLRDALSS